MNGGTDMKKKKKKMKKSGSVKRIEVGSPSSQNLRRQAKPPPVLALPTTAASLQKQSPASAAASAPNYTKSTSTRKEQPEVSTTSPQTGRDGSSLCRKSLNSSHLSLNSSKKATKTSARTTSLRMITTLTKTPSFKPAKALVQEGSAGVLCENLDVERATCSSTLKGCKFPDYLKLSPGGTESKGTSAMKVCRYSYCSLNGHQRARFLSARRPTLNTQRSIKLGCLSPRPRPRPTGGGPNIDKKPLIQYDWTGSTISPLTQGEYNNFFVEIDNTEKGESPDLMASVKCRDETATQNHEEVAGMPSDGQICYVIDSRENLEQIATAAHFHEKNQDVKIADEVSPPSLAQEAKLEVLNDAAEESMPSVEFHEQDYVPSDMGLERGQSSPMYLDDDYEYIPNIEKDLGQQGGKITNDAERVIKLDNRLGWCFDEVSQESFDEESLSSCTPSTSDDCESVGPYDYQESLRNMKTSAPVVVPVPKAAPEGKSDFLFEGNQTPTVASKSGDTTTCYDVLVKEGTPLDNLKDKCLPNEDATAVMGNQELDLLRGPVEEMTTTISNDMFFAITKDQVLNQTSSDDVNNLSDECQTNNTENQDDMEKDCNQAGNFITVSPMVPSEPYSAVSQLNCAETACNEVHEVKSRIIAMPQTEESCSTRATLKCKKSIQDSDKLGHFNPREPDFLPLEPDPEGEKVDLRHQELDERKNAEEWMVDYALRQAVTELGPARRRKVALLVEAFERVMPITKC